MIASNEPAISLPNEKFRYASVLAGTLVEYSDILAVNYNLTSSRLKVKIDTQLITPKKVVQTINDATRKLDASVFDCNSKSDFVCELFTLIMSNGLLQHYKNNASLEINPAIDQNGIIKGYIKYKTGKTKSLSNPLSQFLQVPIQ